jgi:hypothetical protein
MGEFWGKTGRRQAGGGFRPSFVLLDWQCDGDYIPAFILLKPLIPGTVMGLLLGLLAGGLCYVSAGNSLGFYLGPVMLAGVLAPPLVAGQYRLRGAIFVAGAFLDAIGLIWLIPVFEAGASYLLPWFLCYLTLGAFVIALSGGAWACRRLLGPTLGAAVVTILALAWLLWPVWMSPYLAGDSGASTAAWLSGAHPLLAINHIMPDLGAWTQQRLMYQYTALGQDVPLALPRTIWPCVAWHVAMGLALLWAGSVPRRRRRDQDPVESSTTTPTRDE